MTMDGKILRPILDEMAARRMRITRDAEERRRAVYAAIPRICEIDTELRTTPLAIMRAAFSQKKDAASQLRAVRAHNLELQRERAELLVAHGYAYDHLEPQYECRECEDTGYLAPGEPCACLREAYRKELSERLCRQLGMTGEDTFGAFRLALYPKERQGGAPSPYEQMSQVYDYCVEYSKHFGPDAANLFFSGAPGLGKTKLAGCIAVEVARGGWGVVYGTAFEIFSALEDKKFGRGGEDNDPARYTACDLLVIDDLGSEMTTAFTVAAFYQLINERLLAGKKTILISTCGVEELGRKYNAQLASRLRGEFVWLAFRGEDIREKLRK